MSENSTDMQLLVDYLDGLLEGPALAAFEERLASDDRLRKETEHLRDIRDAIRRYGLRQKVVAVRNEMKASARATVPKKGRLKMLRGAGWQWAAAAVLLLFIVGIYQYLSLTPANLYKQLYQPYTVPTTRGGGNESELIEAYRKGAFNRVVLLFTEKPAPRTEDYFYVGNAYLQLGNTEGAILAFQRLLEANRLSGARAYEDAAEYYLALSYLTAGRTAESLSLFEKIYRDDQHAYHDLIGGWSLRKLRWLNARK